MSEWLKEHAWKVCIRQRIEGSNPSLTAISMKRALSKERALFIDPGMGGVGSNPGSTKWQDSHFGLPTAARRASAMDGASQSRPGAADDAL